MHGTTRLLTAAAAALLALSGPPANAQDHPGMMLGSTPTPSTDLPGFAEIDENGDQRISPTELDRARAARLVQHGRALPEDEGAPGFAAMDLNGDGLIDRRELELSRRP